MLRPQNHRRFRMHCLFIGCTVFVALCFSRFSFAGEATGEQVYRDQCARCHGKSGEGTKDNYPDPLVGDKSVAQLTEYIHQSMPDDADEKCPAEDAAKVAAYIYDAFYSADAHTRNKPARVELSRLTVRQHENAIADIIGSFRPPVEWGNGRGLHAEYFNSREPKGDARKIERTDAEVQFDWGQSSPNAEKLDAQEFSAKWQGAVLAPDTGTYEFIVRTEHAVRLYINDLDVPLIDAWVQSGSDTEQRGELRLLGGRPYALRLEFSRAKLGVKDKEKAKQKKAEFRPNAHTSVALAWKRPNHTPEVIAARFLSTNVVPPLFVMQTRFPPDDRSVGYERGTAISKAWDEATTEAAIETARYVAEHIKELSGAKLNKPANEPILRKFCTLFAEQAFRRPLNDEQVQFFVNQQFETAPDFTTAVKEVVLLVLKSPRFLYREIGGTPGDQFDTAARLSFGLWDSVPDRDLISVAKKGELATREQIELQLRRMLSDLRTRSKLREFLLIWLRASQPKDLSKDPKVFPDFTADVASDLRTSLELSLDDVLDNPSADYRQLMLNDSFWLNGRLAHVYGVMLPADAQFQKVNFEPDHRAGVLSHPYLLASLAYNDTSSPIHRGVFLTRSVLGRVLRPPAMAVAPTPADLNAALNTRERVALQTQPEACQGCHAMINPLGFTMEHFDAIGRFRDAEKNRPVDSTGSYLTPSGELEKFAGIKDVAAFVASSDESQTAFVKQLFHHAIKQPIFAYGPNELHSLQQRFAKNDLNIHKLLLEIVADGASVSANSDSPFGKGPR